MTFVKQPGIERSYTAGCNLMHRVRGSANRQVKAQPSVIFADECDPLVDEAELKIGFTNPDRGLDYASRWVVEV